MFISEKLVRDYQKIYERKFGQNISAGEAEQMLSDFAELIKLMETVRSSRYESQSKK